jgi:hypothetical protein
MYFLWIELEYLLFCLFAASYALIIILQRTVYLSDEHANFVLIYGAFTKKSRKKKDVPDSCLSVWTVVRM